MESVEHLIVGGGPAGLRAAQVLAESGREALVAEKRPEIGPKTCAGGLTTYEAAFIGLPAINVVHQPGWTFLFEELSARGACITLRPGADSLRRAVDLVASLARDRKRLLSIHLATRNLIPAGGAARIARKLHAMSVGA